MNCHTFVGKDIPQSSSYISNMTGHTEGIGLGLVAPPLSTGIKVIIVGAGFAGLGCAIECKRKGHDVVVLEKFRELKVLGNEHVLLSLNLYSQFPPGDVNSFTVR